MQLQGHALLLQCSQSLVGLVLLKPDMPATPAVADCDCNAWPELVCGMQQ